MEHTKMKTEKMLKEDEGENEGLKAIREHEECIDEETEARADLIRKYGDNTEL